jgi:hypothetical protein
MENSEIKSLISAGSSNLAKTKKLLSITQKIFSEIKPQYESVRIGNQEWMTNLPAFEPHLINIFIGFKFLSNILSGTGSLVYLKYSPFGYLGKR